MNKKNTPSQAAKNFNLVKKGMDDQGIKIVSPGPDEAPGELHDKDASRVRQNMIQGLAKEGIEIIPAGVDTSTPDVSREKEAQEADNGYSNGISL